MAVLPTQTVTFLFTDIEGSTQRWERYPQLMGAAVQRHDELVRSSIERHGGYVFKTMGDSFCAAFSDASEALIAALEAQRSLHEVEWGTVGSLRVRMALHTGVAEERDNDYFGPCVNRVARILSVGYGSQTLLSGTTRALVTADIAAGCGFVDLGEHRLKDLSSAERIFQLIAPGLPADFPALKSLNRRAHNLPTHPTPLVGRAQELEQLRELLRDSAVRLVTLTGPGGTGKTRLSLQVAAESIDDFSDGVFFVPLDSAPNEESMAAAIAYAMGINEGSSPSLSEGLKEQWGEKTALLLLDNFEQITEASPVVAKIMASCPNVKFLVTSRILLKLRGEREFPLAPLALPRPGIPVSAGAATKFPAIELFVQRAQAAKPSFELTSDNVASVVEICRSLDGLPLAIELAAARVKMLAPAAMVGYLKNRLKLLTGGARDLPERQRTLRAAIAWSYDTLSEAEQTLFRRLSYFSASCTLESILAICESPDEDMDVFEAVASLVDKSLLRQEERGDETRFWMLGTIREYGLEQLAADPQGDEIGQRHAAYFADWTQESAVDIKEGTAAVLERCELEHDNLHTALEWLLTHEKAEDAVAMSIVLADFWERQGRFREARECLLRCFEAQKLALAGNQPLVDQRAKIAGLVGWFFHLQGDYESAKTYQRQSLELYEASSDMAGEAEALNNLALTAQTQGQEEEARGLFERSLLLARQLGDEAKVAARLSNLGLLAIHESRFDAARSYLEEAQQTYDRMGDAHGTAACLCNLGELAIQDHDYGAAQEFSSRSLSLFRRIQDRRGIAYTLANLAEVSVRSGNYSSTAPLLGEAISIAWETGMHWLIPTVLEIGARSLLALDRRGDALLWLAIAIRMCEVLRLPSIDVGALALTDAETGQLREIGATLVALDTATLVARALETQTL